MSPGVETVEDATPETFRAKNYILLNPDVAAYVRDGGSAARHFKRHGHLEGRRQLSRAFTDSRSSAASEKYRHFRPVLDANAGAAGRFRRLRGWRKPLPLAFGGSANKVEDYDGESANAGLHEFVVELEADPKGRYLDVGCGFRSKVYPNCLYVDVYPSLTADIVMAPACVYPFADNAFDGISCLAVLEHVEEPWSVAREFHRMVKPGGKVFIDWPFLQPVHGYPSHFYNATREGLARMFREGFDLITLDTFPNQTPDHTLTWILREFVDAIADEGLRAEFLDASLGDVLSTSPGQGLWSRVLPTLNSRALMGLACGNTLIARKR